MAEAPWPIGVWATRSGTRAHLVDSEVTDRIVMRCGRQMRLKTKRGELVFEAEPSAEPCEQCEGRIDPTD